MNYFEMCKNRSWDQRVSHLDYKPQSDSSESYKKVADSISLVDHFSFIDHILLCSTTYLQWGEGGGAAMYIEKDIIALDQSPKGESFTHITSNRCHLPKIAVQSRVEHDPNQPKQGGAGASPMM